MKHRIIALLLAAALCLALLPTAVFAAEPISGVCGENLTWTLDTDGVLTVSGTGEMSFDECPWDAYRSEIKTVVLTQGVTTVAAEAFADCTALTDVRLPEGLLSVGYHAFGNCTALPEITIPRTVTALGPAAFAGASSLAAIRIAADSTAFCTDESGVVFDKEKTELICAPALLRGDYAIPEGVKRLQIRAFYGCNRLTNVSVPASVTYIMDAAFGGCPELRGIWVAKENTAYSSDESGVLFDPNSHYLICCPAGEAGEYHIPDDTWHIVENAFADCKRLTSVTVPASVESFGKYIFYNCTALTDVYFLGNAPFRLKRNTTFLAVDPATGEEKTISGLTVHRLSDASGWMGTDWEGCPLAQWDGKVTPPHVHSYTESVTATCLQAGLRVFTCSCGDSYTVGEAAALGHAWDEGKVTTAPTTEKEGVRTFTCTRCELTRTEPIDKLQATASFKDVDEKAYYAAAVEWAVAKNITKGTAADTFAPNDTCTRGQVVTFLWRAAGEPKPSGAKNPFTDVKEGSYYYEAVLWAVEQGITTGTSATTFSPNEGCTRGQVATFLWRYENKPASAAKNPFEDVKQGAYYYEAVLWAVEADVTKGTSATTFAPNDTCTRGQIVTFLYRDIA